MPPLGEVKLRRKAGRQPTKGEDPYRLLFESNPQPMWVYDAETLGFLAVNQAAVAHYGFSRDEFLNMTIKDIRPPEDVPRLISRTKSPQVVGGGPNPVGTWQHRKKSGELITVEVTRSAIHFASRSAFLVLAIDATQRIADAIAIEEGMRLASLDRDVSHAVIQSQTLPEILQRCAEAVVTHLDAALARIWTLNENEHVLELQGSAGMYTHTDGAHRRVLLGKLKIGAIAQEQRPHLTNQVIGDPGIPDQAWAKREGLIAFAGYPLIFKDHVVGVIAMFARKRLTDVTLKSLAAIADSIAAGIGVKHAEEKLRKSEERFTAFMRHLPGVAVIKDLNGRYVYYSESLPRLLKQPQTDLHGKRDDEIWPPEIAKKYLENDQRVLTTLEALETLEPLPQQDGVHSWLVYKFPMFDSAGNAAFLGSISIDITERKLLEEQLRQSQKMEAVGRLAGGIAHDFNNLLGVITGYADMLLKKSLPNEPLQRNLLQITKAADRASSLTMQLLTFSRRQIIQPKILALSSIIQNVEGMLHRLLGDDVELKVVCHPELASVNVDAGQIEQVLMNLVVNARDAMPHGGRITIETTNIEWKGGYVEHRDVPPGSYVMLAVSDTGCGMDEQTKARMFEPFFTTKEPGKGTGLGLSTVYGIIKQNGGYIWVYSEVDVGTTFKVYFPALQQSPEIVTDQRVPDSLRMRTETVLVIEDQELFRAMIYDALGQNGYRVLVAESGEEALKICKRQTDAIDLVLTDVVMPRMSGPQVAENIKALFPKVKVLFMSGYADDAIVRHGILPDNAQFLQKPFPTDTLLRKLDEILSL